MNDWMIPDIQWDESYQPDRGKVYDAAQLKDMDAFYRYLDVDGDAIPWRTLPGVDSKGAYFVRGSGHNKLGGYTEKSDEYKDVVDRLRRKFDTAASLIPAPILNIDASKPREKGCALLSIGSCDGAIREARDRMQQKGHGNLDYMRIQGFPFHKDVADFIACYDQIFVIEQNRDAQLRQLLTVELDIDPKVIRVHL